MTTLREQQFFEKDDFSTLAALEEGHFWFEERNLLLDWCIRRFFPEMTSLCEVGCGTGFVLRHLQAHFPAVKFTAAEFFLEAIIIARKRVQRVNFLQADARVLPFRQDFDVVGAFDVIEHIEEDELVLQQLHNSLKPGGGLILTVPQHRFLWSRNDEIAHHKRRYSRAELTGKVERAGFRILRCTSFVTLLLPVMLASRWLNHFKHSGKDAIREFQLAPSVNGLFRFVLSIERGLIRSGLPLPCGGSLLLAAVRQ